MGCSTETIDSTMDQEENNSDIRLSGWYRSDEHNKDIIDVMNFGDVEETVNITTICYDKDNNTLPSHDSSVLKIPPQMKWTWIPECPTQAASYTIGLKKAE